MNIKSFSYSCISFLSIIFLLVSILGFPLFKWLFVLSVTSIFVFEGKFIFLYLYFAIFFLSIVFFPTWVFELSMFYFASTINSAVRKKNVINILLWLFFFYCTFILIKAFSGVNPSEIFPFVSRNHLGTFPIAVSSVFLLKRYQIKDLQLLLVIILTVLISIFSISRGNILSSLVLVLIFVFDFSNLNHSKIKNVVIFILFSIIVGLFVLEFKEYAFEKSFSLEKLSQLDPEKLGEEQRSVLISKSLERLDFMSMIWGYNSDDFIYIFNGYENLNFHNSYLDGFSKLGFRVFLFYAFIVYFFRFNVLYLVPLFLRGFSDSLLFFSGEISFFIYLAIFLHYDRPSKINN